MALVIKPLSIEEFRRVYAGSDERTFEYWFGEAVQKAVPTTLHGVLQYILCVLLEAAGLRVSSEVELRIDPDWQPKPDVIASVSRLEMPYPTTPVEVVAEVLSPDDPMPKVFKKCREYVRIGIARIFVFDPEAMSAWEWSRETDNLERVYVLELPNGAQVPVATIWRELDKRLGADGKIS